MSLPRQSANIVLYQGIDTKTNTKLVEGKLLEMENCEINNQQIVKSPGSVSLAESQTGISPVQDQKGIVTAYNTMIVADNNSVYKYNSDQDILNKVDNLVFSQNSEYTLYQNISQMLTVSSSTVNQLYQPTSTIGMTVSVGLFQNYCVPQPISCQWGKYLFTVIYQVTQPDSFGKVGQYQILLYDTSTKTTIYQAIFPTSNAANSMEIPQDAVATPAGVYFYTVYIDNAGSPSNVYKVNEYYLSYDLQIVNLAGSPNASNIFPDDPVLLVSNQTINNITNYCSFLACEYSDSFIFFAFREGTYGNFAAKIAVRDLNGNVVLAPASYATGLTMATGQTSQNFCTFIFSHPVTQANYFVALFANTYIVIDTAQFLTRASFTSTTSSGYSTHSLGFLQNTSELVALLHDISEQGGGTPPDTIVPTINKFQLTQTSAGSYNFTVSQTLSGTSGDPRWIYGTYGTSAIAGRVLCVYDKILFPIFYYPFLYNSTVSYSTPLSDFRNSVHLVEFTASANYPGPLAGLTNVLQHVSWVKDYNCSLYATTSSASSSSSYTYVNIPSIMKSKVPFINASTQDSGCFYGFFVESQQESQTGQIYYSHQFNAYKVNIPHLFDFQGFPRSSFYLGAGKLNELTNSTFSEMNFFEFPQLTVGAVTYTASGSSATISNGSYLYGTYYEWTNGNGELVRSAVTETLYNLTTSSGSNGANSITLYTTPPPFFSNKTNAVTRIFRSTINGSVPFFNSNIAITTSAPYYTDSSPDTAINNNQILYTYGGVLEDSPFPAIGPFTLFQNNIFAIDANNPNKIWFSKSQTLGLALASNFAFYFFIDSRDGGATFLEAMDNKLIIFKENSIYVVEGNIPDNTGQNSTLTLPQFVISPVGCNQPNSVVVFPNGIIFKSKKGIWQLDRSLNTHYIGADVEAYNSLTITAAQLLSTQNKVKFTSLEGTIQTYDYYYNTWNIETYPSGILDSTIVDDNFTIITTSGVLLAEDNDINLRNNQNYTMKFTTGWIKLAGLTGYQRLYKIMFLGDYEGSHILKASIAFNYNNEPTEFHYFNPSQNLGIYNAYGNFKWGEVTPYAGYKDSTYLFRLNVVQQKCVSVKLTLEDVFTGLGNQDGSSFSATNVNFDIGVKSNTTKVPSRLQA